METRKLNEQDKKEFAQADKKFDTIVKERRSNVQLERKIFMKISDVPEKDAKWFKYFCDKHTDGKQFLGITAIRMVMERLDPLVYNVLEQINQLSQRVQDLEVAIKLPEEPAKLVIPKTQGKKGGSQ